jgi:hypothetical protein
MNVAKFAGGYVAVAVVVDEMDALNPSILMASLIAIENVVDPTIVTRESAPIVSVNVSTRPAPITADVIAVCTTRTKSLADGASCIRYVPDGTATVTGDAPDGNVTTMSVPADVHANGTATALVRVGALTIRRPRP